MKLNKMKTKKTLAQINQERRERRALQKNCDLNDPKYLKPFEFGWIREVVERTCGKVNCDIYYYTPSTKKKARSFNDLEEILKQDNPHQLELENFTFKKMAIGINDPESEIIRKAIPKKDYSENKNLSLGKANDGENIEFISRRIRKSVTDGIPSTSSSKHDLKLKKKSLEMYKVKVSGLKKRKKNILAKKKFGTKIKKFYDIEKSNKDGSTVPRRKYVKRKKINVEGLTNGYHTKKYEKIKSLKFQNSRMKVDLTDEKFKKPFDFGWRREIVVAPDTNKVGMIYYVSKDGERFNSFTKLELAILNTTLTLDNFTFIRKELGINDTKKEIIRGTNMGTKKQIPFIEVKNLNESNISNFDSEMNFDENDSMSEDALSNIENDTENILTSTQHKIIDPLSQFDTDPITETETNPFLTEEQEFKYSIRLQAALRGTVTNNNLSLKETSNQKITPEHSYASEVKVAAPRNSSLVKIHKKNGCKLSKDREIKDSASNLSFQSMVTLSKTVLDIHLQVFSYLSLSELLKIQRVSKMWKLYTLDSSLWKTITVKSIIKDWNCFINFLCLHKTKHLNLKYLKFKSSDNTNEWEQILSVLPKAKDITELDLCGCPVFVIDEIIGKCKQLEILRLSKCDLSIFQGANTAFSNTYASEVAIHLKSNTIKITENSASA